MEKRRKRKKSNQQSEERALVKTIHSLIARLEEKDPYTAGHSQRVCKYSLLLAEILKVPPLIKETIKQGALLHDLGKINLSKRILHKKGQLKPEEFEEIKKHPLEGAKILESIALLKKYIPILLYHHEREDGKGYQGKKGNEIPLEAKIVAIADAFDAMTSGRDYRKPMSIEEALEELQKNAGNQFKKDYVEKFVQVVNKKKKLIQKMLKKTGVYKQHTSTPNRRKNKS